MTTAELIALGIVFFATAVSSVVTGGTSLLTVPAMMQFGIDPRVAVATNLFALIFLRLGGALPFRGLAAETKRPGPVGYARATSLRPRIWNVYHDR
jgi:uncharacterized membrane protein YfcA